MNQDKVNELKTQIASGNAHKVIEYLMAHSSEFNKVTETQIILQSSKWKQYQQRLNSGTATSEELYVMRNKLDEALLNILHQIEQLNHIIPTSRRSIWKWLGLGIGVLAVVGLALYIFKPKNELNPNIESESSQKDTIEIVDTIPTQLVEEKKEVPSNKTEQPEAEKTPKSNLPTEVKKMNDEVVTQPITEKKPVEEKRQVPSQKTEQSEVEKTAESNPPAAFEEVNSEVELKVYLVTGVVRDYFDRKQIIEGATILLNEEIKAKTNQLGTFIFSNSQAQTYNLKLTFLAEGYETSSEVVELPDPDRKRVSVFVPPVYLKPLKR